MHNKSSPERRSAVAPPEPATVVAVATSTSYNSRMAIVLLTLRVRDMITRSVIGTVTPSS